MQYCLCCAAVIVRHLAVCLTCNNWQVVVSGPAWLEINSIAIVIPLLLLQLVALSCLAASDSPPPSDRPLTDPLCPLVNCAAAFAPMLSSLCHAGWPLTGPLCQYGAALPFRAYR